MTAHEIIEYRETIIKALHERFEAAAKNGQQTYVQIDTADFLQREARFSIMVDVYNALVMPVPADKSRYPPNISTVSLNEFVMKYIHPQYLVPYLVYAETTYEIVLSTLNNVSPAFIQETCKNVYEISVPMKFDGDITYYWYTQFGMAETVTTSGVIIRHVNLYSTKRRQFYKFEKKMLEATIGQDEHSWAMYQERLTQKMNYFFLHPFLHNDDKKMHLLILIFYQYFLDKRHSEEAHEATIAAWMRVGRRYVKTLKSEIMNNLRNRQLDFFYSLREFSEFVEETGCLKLNETQIHTIKNILETTPQKFPKKQAILQKLELWGIKQSIQ
ncbi:MAG: hypothetical protein RLZZ628_4147 [Bacteroidota bacterium]|jgi:hypothetical protein